MDAARRYRDEEYHRTLCELADNRVSRLERSASCAEDVRGVIARQGTRGKIGMGAIARALGVSYAFSSPPPRSGRDVVR